MKIKGNSSLFNLGDTVVFRKGDSLYRTFLAGDKHGTAFLHDDTWHHATTVTDKYFVSEKLMTSCRMVLTETTKDWT